MIKDEVASWLASTHDVRFTDDVSGGATGERYGIFIKTSKHRFITAGYQSCYCNGGEVRGSLWAEIDLISDNTSNHFDVHNAHFKAGATSAAQGATRWGTPREEPALHVSDGQWLRMARFPSGVVGG